MARGSRSASGTGLPVVVPPPPPLPPAGLTAAEMEEMLRTQAALRSHQNAKIVDDYATSVMSALLLVNGGAITAVLAAFGTRVFSGAASQSLAALALFCFGVGIAAALRGVLLQRQNVADWRNIWEERVRGDLNHKIDHRNVYGDLAETSLWAAVGIFLFGAFMVTVALAARDPGPPPAAATSAIVAPRT